MSPAVGGECVTMRVASGVGSCKSQIQLTVKNKKINSTFFLTRIPTVLSRPACQGMSGRQRGEVAPFGARGFLYVSNKGRLGKDIPITKEVAPFSRFFLGRRLIFGRFLSSPRTLPTHPVQNDRLVKGARERKKSHCYCLDLFYLCHSKKAIAWRFCF